MATSANPTRDDFEALLNEQLGGAGEDGFEGRVVKGTVTAIENDMAVIDVGLKTEGRVALREFAAPGRQSSLKIGDEVEVYLERIENALGEAVLSRDKARREESWGRLEKAFQANEKVDGVIFNQVKGGFTVDLDGAVAFLPRSQVDIRPIRDVTPLMNVPQPFQILKMDRRRGNIVVSRRAVLEESRASERAEIVGQLQEGEIREGVDCALHARIFQQVMLGTMTFWAFHPELSAATLVEDAIGLFWQGIATEEKRSGPKRVAR